MNDRYLFRGKRGDDWLVGDLLQQHEPHKHQIYVYNKPGYGCGYLDVESDTVGQCTGLKDNQGKLIFEDDIVRWGRRGIGKVVWLLSGWQVECGDMEYVQFSSNGVEIIGNIHDNSELLEVQNV